MKTTVLISSAIYLFASSVFAEAKVIAGPILNPANGHEYYLLAPATWTASEAEAENLGGTLAVIDDAVEQAWVCSTFGSNGGRNHLLWIGLHRTGARSLAWITGAKADYTNWAARNPDNKHGNENYVEIYSQDDGGRAGTWNDVNDEGLVRGRQPSGVVEVPGKSRPESLTASEQSLVGTWYEEGDGERPCYITSAGNILFAIGWNQSSSRLVYTPAGFLFASHWRQVADVQKDRILWRNATWWSRHALDYK